MVVGDGDMAMDMARLDNNAHCVLEALSDSPCLRDGVTSVVEGSSSVLVADCKLSSNPSSGQQQQRVVVPAAAAAAEAESTEDATSVHGHQFAECLNFVTESGCGDVDVLDFDKLPDELSGEVSGVGGSSAVGEDGELLESVNFEEQSSKSLEENLELRELRELLQHDGSANSVQVGEEEALLLAKAGNVAGDGVSVSDSGGECSSGDRKDNNNQTVVSPKSSCKIVSATTTATATTTTTGTGTKKKAKVDWTPELHRRFVHAVEQLGVEKAFPSRILELMGVQCLTRHNIASHLQKYRSHRRHLAAREAEAASWTHRRTYTQAPWPRSSSRRDGALPYLVPLHTPHIQPRPSIAIPALQPGQHHPVTSTPLKVWGYPTVDHSNVHMWQQPTVAPPPFWQAPDGSYWQHPAASTYDGFSPRPAACYPHPMRVPLAAGSPMVAPGFPDESCYYSEDQFSASMYLCNQLYDSDIGRAAGVAACSKPPETHLSKEVLDAAIGEALANPWTPPPLGLKPPSMEGVIAELQRQGINTVPPSTC